MKEIRTHLSVYMVHLCDNIAAIDAFANPDARCDAIVLIVDPDLAKRVESKLSGWIVQLNVDWINVVGHTSENLHDLIDQASVQIGKQERVGDGIPMTAWHKDLIKIDEMIDFVCLGGLGGYDNKVVVVIGSQSDFENVVTGLEHHRDRPVDPDE